MRKEILDELLIECGHLSPNSSDLITHLTSFFEVYGNTKCYMGSQITWKIFDIKKAYKRHRRPLYCASRTRLFFLSSIGLQGEQDLGQVSTYRWDWRQPNKIIFFYPRYKIANFWYDYCSQFKNTFQEMYNTLWFPINKIKLTPP